ncbi:MAG: bifunctional (p)ppGpp synthetase/guanosine-3',5'-bis(diphosphate) 3'-pyrophosphohydrolase [Bacteroidaceae bacterium]|nr:bifunctional (p)ppGpp synthetase/guanosine-3',5'-bis(diphosphate) 3'-pyrophosphohydrolase [Bacteroidaceae bacterium]MBQ3957714.1 bifunctional (p)ppGpp synthetase/guanosine-3',5'-bis(diphosphate) 3'-pyrophosphohydrolase [Bacteroidaceae bacterium]MBQ3992962.1 bifunctional (p)ppGpp synthetase/guanosine-3',5'-bis(diphosphate) 3'-pyrophosphohydrolase [Bacteroidaceae bacterium]
MTEREIEDEKMVDAAYRHLVDTYLHSRHRKHIEIIEKAYNFARQAHKGVRRLSGEPYIMHPIAVAQIACEEIGLGSTSICASLLHDVVEDTDYTVEDIQNIFGPKIAEIVDGLTKISGGIFGDKASAQAESFKKLLLTMSDDIRVILIKISDRLHNMRTLGSQLPSKQYKIAGETLYIYAPLAHRLGLNKVKEELEDLSFRYEHPDEYRSIRQQLADVDAHLHEIFREFTTPIRQRLDEAGLHYEIKARIKTPYSVWSKMQNKHVTFEEIYDILAVRIIFDPDRPQDEIAQCFQIYATCSSIYKPHPERFRDWLSHPKSNGYQALHTTLMSKSGQWVEVQIRSRRMDEMAEQGFAAHWKYKEGGKEAEDSENELDKWLRTIKEILDDPQPDAIDFLDAIKLNLYANEIFVVTPKGEFKTMPAGATALDFAFGIHTFLGTHCIGAKVNHRLVPISYRLESGDQIEILTSKQPKVTPQWLQVATTAKAKGKIQAILRRQERELQKQGEEQLAAFLRQAEVEPGSQATDRLVRFHQQPSAAHLYSAIARGTIHLGADDLSCLRAQTGQGGWSRYLHFLKPHRAAEAAAPEEQPTAEPMKVDRRKPLILNEETIGRYLICPECHPIPGDSVLGYFDGLSRITIHKRQCPVAARLKASDGNHILAAQWDTHKQLFFPATIRLQGIDHVGVLHQITAILSGQLNINIRQLNIQSQDGIFRGEIQLEVHDATDVQAICRDLKRIQEVEDVTRF